MLLQFRPMLAGRPPGLAHVEIHVPGTPQAQQGCIGIV
jgi:hypothetical protein